LGTKKFISAILGSAVVGGLVTGVITNHFDNKKIEAQNVRLHQSEQREHYTSLGKDTQKLESDLNSAIITFAYAISHSQEKNFEANVETEIDVLSNQMITINQSLASRQIEDPTRKLIIGLFNLMGPTLRDVQKDHRRLPDLIRVYNQSLKQQLADINNHIEDKRKLLAIEK
jgi:hypothetical protein